MTSTIRVGAWNVHEGMTQGGQSFEECVDRVLAERLDLLALQEVPFSGGERPSPLLVSLAERTQLRHHAANVLSPAWLARGQLSGVAVASRFPIEASTTGTLPNPGLKSPDMISFDKGTVTARIEARGRVMAMTSLHLPPFHRFGRRAEDRSFGYIWDDLAKQLEPEGDELLIIAGDFNTPHRQLLLRRMNAGLRSSVTVPTHKGRTIDDIVHSTSAEQVSSRVVQTFSDHCLCVVELRLDAGHG